MQLSLNKLQIHVQIGHLNAKNKKSGFPSIFIQYIYNDSVRGVFHELGRKRQEYSPVTVIELL